MLGRPSTSSFSFSSFSLYMRNEVWTLIVAYHTRWITITFVIISIKLLFLLVLIYIYSTFTWYFFSTLSFMIVIFVCFYCMLRSKAQMWIHSASQPVRQPARQSISQSAQPVGWVEVVQSVFRGKKKNMRRIDYVITFNAFIKNICTKIPLMLAVGCEVIWLRFVICTYMLGW